MNRTLLGKPLAGVIGHPVAHSISPEIFRFLARRSHKRLEYLRLDCAAPGLPNLIGDLRKKPFVGCNVTIPHKQTVLDSMDALSPEVRLIGAANVIRSSGGRLKGFNTDVFGIERTFRSHGVSVPGKTCVIFGAGGAARAAAYFLGRSKAKEVGIINRRGERASELAKEFSRQFPGTRYYPIVRGVPQAEIYIQATPIGMFGFPQKGWLSRLKQVPADAFAFDMVYTPEQTFFLREAKRLGMKTAGGLDMLVWQALRTWEIWFGPLDNRDQTHAALKRALRRKLR